ncbi:MAG: acyltransferase [Geminicoccaceae bacterium]|nr:acyltransferase [Geminicoccaceae bacterium]
MASTTAAVGFPALFVPARPHARHIRTLTSLRFFAAFWVVILHFSKDMPFDPDGATYLVHNARAGVDLFFMLSGFIMAHCYLEGIAGGGFAWGTYLRRRLARIYPLHVVTLLPFLLLFAAAGAGYVRLPHPEAYDAAALLPNLLLLHAWGTTDHLTFNYPSWSISAEWFAYLLFPGMALAVLRLRPLASLFVALAALGLAWFLADSALPRPLMRLTYDFGILRIVPAFLLGIAVYRLSLVHDVAPWLLRPLLAVTLLALALLFHALPSPILGVPLLAFLIFLLAGLDRQAPTTGFARPSLLYLGEISYAIYMVHALVDVFFFGFLELLWPTPGPVLGFAFCAIGLALVLVLAVLAHRLVERPARTWLAG